MQVYTLLSKVQQQVPLVLTDKHAGDAALLLNGEPCQLGACFQIVYSDLRIPACSKHADNPKPQLQNTVQVTQGNGTAIVI